MNGADENQAPELERVGEHEKHVHWHYVIILNI